MCGIAGILQFDEKPVELELLKAMTDRLTHRGPDSEGFWIDGRIGFGHRRLAIIDVNGSPQPMASADNILHLTARANGCSQTLTFDRKFARLAGVALLA